MGGYYDWDGESLQEISRRYVENGEKVNDREIEVNGYKMWAHAVYMLAELIHMREYEWDKGESVRLHRHSDESWDDLSNSLATDGFTQPVHITIGKDGGIRVTEGNHRLAMAQDLHISMVPVMLHFTLGTPRKKDTIEL